MGQSSELSIALHNDALESDADYAAKYESWMRDLDAYLASEQNQIDEWPDLLPEMFGEYRIDHTGYEQFDICQLCEKPATLGLLHDDCANNERLWSEALTKGDIPI